MDRPEEAAESVNPREQGLSASEPSESNVPNELTEALLRISQDMAWVLDRLNSKKTWSRGIPWVEHGRVRESQILVRKIRKGIRRG